VWINLLCNEGTGGRTDGTTINGVAPFRKPGDLSTPNEAYFRRVDAILKMAEADGIVVFLDPIETAGWLDTLLQNGAEKGYAYGRFLGLRYRSFPNIVWLNGNDLQRWQDPEVSVPVLSVAAGIKSVDPTHIQTVELNYVSSGSRDDPRWTPIIGLDAAYTYYPTYAQVLKEYNRADHLPTFLVEANYEFEHYYQSPQTLRRQEYWSLLSGATGQLYGNKYTWPFLRGWQSHLDTVGVQQLRYVTKLFGSNRWFELRPDQRHLLVTAGYGTFQTSGLTHVNDSDYVTAARTPDGRLALAYLPISRPVTVDLSRMSSRVRARWYDPTSGRYVAAARSLLRNRGTAKLVPPQVNGAGQGDWVLVLTVASG